MKGKPWTALSTFSWSAICHCSAGPGSSDVDWIYGTKNGSKLTLSLGNLVDGAAYIILLVGRVRPCTCHPEITSDDSDDEQKSSIRIWPLMDELVGGCSMQRTLERREDPCAWRYMGSGEGSESMRESRLGVVVVPLFSRYGECTCCGVQELKYGRRLTHLAKF
jgi:hypothetical protein